MWSTRVWIFSDDNRSYYFFVTNTSISRKEGRRGKPKGKPRYPIGLSLGVIGWSGRAPKCAGCGQSMNRGSERLLLGIITNKVKGWTTETSFHLEEDCISAKDWGNQIRARSLIAPSPNATSSDQSPKVEKQRARRRTVLKELSTSLGPAWTRTLSPRSGRWMHSNIFIHMGLVRCVFYACFMCVSIFIYGNSIPKNVCTHIFHVTRYLLLIYL